MSSYQGHATMKAEPHSHAEAVEALRGKPSRRIGNNTSLRLEPDGSVSAVLHDTAIVTWHTDGRTTISTGGWNTVTTRGRLQGILGGTWHVYSNMAKGGPRLRDYATNREWPLVDGMTLPGPKDFPPKEGKPIRRLTRDQAVAISEGWWSVNTWGDPGVCLYAFGSTGKVQSEEHRANVLAYIKEHCLPGCAKQDDPKLCRRELAELSEYIRTAPIESMERKLA
jgi:hypothetical protein